MKRFFATAALLATAVAAPASAVTLVANYNAAGTAVGSVSKSNISINVAVSAVRFRPTPSSLANLSQTVVPSNSTSIVRTAAGLGISGGGSGTQMDTNQLGTVVAPLREAFLVTGTKAFYLTNLVLTSVDADDTLLIYGVNTNGTLVKFSYGTGTSTTAVPGGALAGTIKLGAGGSLLGLTYGAANGGTASFGTGLVDTRFTRYLITTRVGGDVQYLGTGGQGFALSGLTATVPEPATWGLLLVGFSMVGVAARRRSRAVAA